MVRELEDGQVGLEAALAHYEHGVRLVKHCLGQLLTPSSASWN